MYIFALSKNKNYKKMKTIYLVNHTSVSRGECDIYHNPLVTISAAKAQKFFRTQIERVLRTEGKFINGDRGYIIETIERGINKTLDKILKSEGNTWVKNEDFEFLLSENYDSIDRVFSLKTDKHSYEIEIQEQSLDI